MFAGIDVASERHRLARLDDAGKPTGKPVPITGDRDGHDKLLAALAPRPPSSPRKRPGTIGRTRSPPPRTPP